MADTKTKWRCQNHGACSKADNREPILLERGQSFACPECPSDIGLELKNTGAGVPVKPIAIGAGVLLLLGVGLPKLFSGAPRNAPIPVPQPIEQTPSPEPKLRPLVDTRTGLSKQILARPKSSLYKESKGDDTLGKKAKDFQRFFVFKEEDGRMNVGDTRTAPTAWMAADDTLDWPHSMVVEYTTPDNRRPVMFFREKQALQNLAESDSRSAEVDKLYAAIDASARESRRLPAEFPVLSIEPARQIHDLYLMPVVEFREQEIGGRPGRLLKVSAAGSRRGATTLDDPKVAKNATPVIPQLNPVDLDLVFVMDMTGSMQPWVDTTMEVIRGLANKVNADPALSKRMRLGFWGYQDSPRFTDIQYRTRNFTPDLLDAGAFINLLKGIKVNKLTTDDYEEDVFAGMFHAIHDTKWAEEKNRKRIIVVIGDAPGHTSKSQGAEFDYDAPQIRDFATGKKIQIVSLAINDSSNPDYIKYHRKVNEQFTTLATNGNRKPAILVTSFREGGDFKELVEVIAGELLEQKESTETPAKTPSTIREKGLEIARGLLASAKADIVADIPDAEGRPVEAPRDITGWVSDLDLGDPTVRALEPKLLVTKRELDDLKTTAEGIIRGAQESNQLGGGITEKNSGSSGQIGERRPLGRLDRQPAEIHPGLALSKRYNAHHTGVLAIAEVRATK